MTDQTAVSHPSRDADPTPSRDALAEVGYPSIWLIFLMFPVVSLLGSDASMPWRLLAACALFAFAVLYMASWWWTSLVPAWGHTANTVLWFFMLAAAMVAMVPAIGPNALSPTPFLIATLAFKLPIRTALMGIVPLVITFVALSIQWGAPYIYWVPSTLGGSAILMLAISWLIDREDRTKGMTHDLEMARQRETIGRDVHDLLGHSLTVITVKTELARKLLERDPQRAAAELDEVLSLSREALAEVRATVGQLRTPQWSSQVAAARTALRAANIETKLPSSSVTIPPTHSVLMAWCLREAVTNVIRHSGATRCVVEASANHLTVIDDGAHAPAVHSYGNGLQGMEQRVREAGGSLSVSTANPGQDRPGTKLEVLLP